MAFTIGKKVGSAVVRNRLRRRLRMLMRRLAPRMRPGAYLVGVAPEAATLTFSELEDLVEQIMKSLDSP